MALPSATDNFVRDYSAVKEDITALAKMVNDLSPKFGTGSPEGVVIANLSLTYYDTTNAPVSATMYINETIGSDINWLVIA